MKKHFSLFLVAIISFSAFSQVIPFATELNVPQAKYVPKKWNCYWITNPDIHQSEYNVSLYRKTFNIDVVPDSFIINVSADNRYYLYINGKLISYGPQLSDVRHWRYETINIAPFLKTGKNSVAAEVVNYGLDKFYGIISHKSAFMLNGYSDREKIINSEDKTWKTYYNRAIRPNHPNWMYAVDIIGGFYASNPADSVYGNKHPWGWETTDYDDSQWKTAKWCAGVSNSGGFGWVLQPRNTPLQVVSVQRFPTVGRSTNTSVPPTFLKGESKLTIPANTKCSFLIDNKVLTLGYPQLVLSGGKEAKISLCYAENLYDKNREKGNRNDINNKSIVGIKDIFIADGGTQRVYKTTWFRSFRFVQIDVETKSEALTIDDYYNLSALSPLQMTSRFKSDNPLYDKVMDICWRTASLCTQDNLVSDAYYEQMQYVGDSRVHAMTLVALTGDSLYLKNAIEMFNYSRMPDGNITSCYPLRATFVHPTFSLIWIDMIHDYMMYFGNKAFIKQFVPGLYATFFWFENNLNQNGIPGEPAGSYFVDWYYDKKTLSDKGGVAPTSREGNSAVVTLHYIYTLENAAHIYTYIDMPYEAEKCKKRAEELKKTVKNLFFDAQKGIYAEDPAKTYFDQRPNIMAINTRLVEKENQVKVIAKILKDTSYINEAGYYYRFNFFNALAEAGQGAGVYFDEVLRLWDENMIKLGMSTTPERPVKQRSEAHPWSTSPAYAYFHVICGIRPANEGFTKMTIAPDFGKNKNIEATYTHKFGFVNIKLKKTGEKTVEGEITIPKGLEATFYWEGKSMVLAEGIQKIKM